VTTVCQVHRVAPDALAPSHLEMSEFGVVSQICSLVLHERPDLCRWTTVLETGSETRLMKFREARWEAVVVNLKRKHDSQRRRPQPAYAELAENDEERAWTRDATCAGWNATALPVDVPVVKFFTSADSLTLHVT
jgi:hypothetical protein